MTGEAALQPRLFVVARPALDEAALEAFLDSEDTTWRRTAKALPPEEVVELAGRLCYMSYGDRQSPKDNRGYIEHLVKQGHDSVLEHATWTFILAGVTRAFTHQFVRHRIGFSYSQLSQQYHDERDADAVMPEVIRGDPQLATLWADAVDAAQRTYRRLADELSARDVGLPDPERRRLFRSAARTVLPEATETKIAFTANARSLRHFLYERGNLPGDEEMRTVSILLLDTMTREAPALFGDFEVREGPGGKDVVTTR